MKDILTKYNINVRQLEFWLLAVAVVVIGAFSSLQFTTPPSSQSAASLDATLSATSSTPLTILATPSSCDSGKVALSWQLVGGATGYRLYRDSALIYDGGNTNFTDSNLVPVSVHTYTLVAYSTTATTQLTATTNATAPITCVTTALSPSATGTPNTGSIPSAPNGLSITAGACGVPALTLSWQAVSGADAYRVTRSGALLSDSPNLSYVDTTLSLSTSYAYTVFAYNTHGVSAGTTVTGTTAPICTATTGTTPTTTPTTSTSQLPQAPTGLKAQAGSCGDPSVKISWQGASGSTYGYKVYRNDLLITTLTGNSTTDLITTPSTSYTYAVYAINASGTSPAAVTHITTPSPCATTPLTTPPAAGDATGPTTVVQTPVAATDSGKKTPDVPVTDKPVAPSPSPATTLSSVAPEIIQTTTAPTAATAFTTSIENISTTIDDFKKAASETQTQLAFVVNQNAYNIIAERKAKGLPVDAEKVNAARDALLKKINDRLDGVTVLSLQDVTHLSDEVQAGINAMRLVAGDTAAIAKTDSSGDALKISDALSSLTTTVKGQSTTAAGHELTLLYKDSNNDGISDYDSVHIYHLSPTASSPVSEYNGKKINAADKVLLGYDPTKKELVHVAIEEPASSTAPIVSTNKVQHVESSDATTTVFKGKALPNAFITLFIYSTPVIVTIKANADGEWQYTLDKELESGNHTVYTATVNNAGKILAKSPGFLFTRTAEAKAIAPTPAQTPLAETAVEKPGLLEGNVPLIGGSLIVIIIGAIMLFIAGRKREQT